jgi:hypothetical protein
MERENMYHKIELKGEENSVFSKLYIDDEEVSGVKGVELEHFAGEVPTAMVHLAGFLDVKTLGKVMYVANEEGVYAATKYLRESVEKDEALRDEFKSRILSAIDDMGKSCDGEELAHKILDVIFGE